MLSSKGDHPMTNHRPQQEAARHHPVGARRRAAQPRQQGRGPARDRPQRPAVRADHRRRPRRRPRPARRPHEPGRLPGRAARPRRPRTRPGRRRPAGRPRGAGRGRRRARAEAPDRARTGGQEPAGAEPAAEPRLQPRPADHARQAQGQGEGQAGARPRRPTKPTPRAGTKQAQLIDLLKRPEGATVEQIAAATGWQHHTIRGAISGALKKKLGLNVEATRTREVGPNKVGRQGQQHGVPDRRVV